MNELTTMLLGEFMECAAKLLLTVLLIIGSASSQAMDCQQMAKGLPDLGKAIAKLHGLKSAQVAVEPLNSSATAFKLTLENEQVLSVYQINLFDFSGYCSLTQIEDKGTIE